MIDFYKEKWQGSFDGTDEELKKLLSRCVDIVNNAIAFSGYTVNTAPDVVSERVKKAVCAQADHIDAMGGIDCITDAEDVSSATIGRFSYQSSGNNHTAEPCGMAYQYLAPTGLLYRGCRTC